MEKIIEVKNVTKVFNGKKVIDKINLTVYKGQRFGLLGPNGSGKTTLIQMMLGLTLPDKGQIKLFGQTIDENSIDEIRQKINYASVFSRLQERLTIKENLITFARLYGVAHPEEKINQLIDFFDLRGLVEKRQRILSISSGEQARVLLCKALINDPEILFLDEPTASLDPAALDRIRDFILHASQRKQLTIIYTSHNLGEVKRICTHIGFLENGRLKKTGSQKHFKELRQLFH